MSVKQCLADVIADLKQMAADENKHVSIELLERFGQQLYELQQKGLSRAEYFAEVRKIVDKEFKTEIQKAHVEALQNVERVTSAVMAVNNRVGNKSLIGAAIDAIEGGGLKASEGSNRSPRIIMGQYVERFMPLVRVLLDKHKAILESGALRKEIYQELYNLQNGGKDMVGKSTTAFEIAQSFHLIQERLFRLKRAFNPTLKRAADFIIHRSHNIEKIKAMGEEKWVAFMMENFNQKSFAMASAADKQALFKDIYNRIIEGRYGTPHDRTSMRTDVMQRMAMSRELIPNDWEAAYRYDAQFGDQNMALTLMKFINRSARDLALLEKFGSKPQEFFEDFKQLIRDTASDKDYAKFQEKEPALNNAFNNALGKGEAPALNRAAENTQIALTWSYLAHAGQAALSSMTDLAMAPGLLRGVNGKTVFENAATIFGKYLRFMADSKSRGEVLEHFGIFTHSLNKELFNIVGGAEVQPGRLVKAAQLFGKFILLDRHIEAIKAAIVETMGAYMGKKMGVGFDGLDIQFKNTLLRYGIKEAEWDIVRTVATSKSSGDWKYKVIDMDTVEKIPTEKVVEYIKKTKALSDGEITPELVDRTRYELMSKVGTMLNEFAHIGSSTPDMKQSRWMFGGSSINEGTGMMLRIFWQFKSAGMTTLANYQRIAYSGVDPAKSDWAGVGQTVMLASFYWAMQKYAKDALMGKEPEDPTQPSFVLQAAAGSGAGGFVFDALANEWSKESNLGTAGNIAKTIAGPIYGTSLDLLAMTKTAADAIDPDSRTDGMDVVHQFTKWGISQIPFQNALIAKPILHTYLFNGIKELTHEGYLSNLEESVEKTPGFMRRFGGKEEQGYWTDLLRPTVIE